MGKLTALAVAVIVLLLAGLGLVVYRLAEFSVPGPASGRGPGRADGWQLGLSPYPSFLAGNEYGAPIMIETPQLRGPPPAWLPEDPVEAQKMLHGFRKQQVREQVEQVNRRKPERQGHAQAAGQRHAGGSGGERPVGRGRLHSDISTSDPASPKITVSKRVVPGAPSSATAPSPGRYTVVSDAAHRSDQYCFRVVCRWRSSTWPRPESAPRA